MKKIIVIGGCNIDFIGKSDSELVTEDSNIGKVSVSFGGVARNIVENMARLGVDVTFVTAIGNDSLGKALKQELVDLNVKVLTPTNIDTNSGMYLAIHDDKGKMVLGLCDQEIIDYITISYLKEIDEIIESFDYLFIDTNLKKEIIDYLLIKYCDKVIFTDVISTIKAKKILSNINMISYLKCNEIEAKSMFGDDYFKGFKDNTLIVTRGKNDILYNEGSIVKSFKVDKVNEIINETGSGDAFFGAFIYGILNGYSIEKAIALGQKNASLTLKVKEAVNKNLTKELIED